MKEKFKEAIKKIKSITKLKGSPYVIAMGAAVGIFWNFIPSLGVGPFLSIGTAKLLKASGIAAVTMNLATGLFIPIMYSMNMMMGRFLSRQEIHPGEVGDALSKSLKESMDVVEEPSRYFVLDKLQAYSTEFFLGGFVNAVIAASIIYTTLWGVLSFRQQQVEKKRKRKQLEEN
ncbi:hypothetical protein GGQ84_000203 [Desulfitispora alkaliphila]|uniref:DUF2062 domain-containing protein n=1 Tax=Desulfitispora alkaliphila TaxID=622674 RepID=UPI003D249C48